MSTRLALAALLLSVSLIPSLTFAQNRGDDEAKQNRGLHLGQIKRKVDMQVSLVGKVTALNGTTITLLAQNSSTYTVDASQAKFIRRFHGAMKLADIQVNDQLYVQGTLLGTSIKAKLIQDLSLQARNGTFHGTVVSLSSNSFVLQSQNRGQQTIFVSSSTKILKGNDVGTFADLLIGAQVRVDGVWNNTNNNVQATKIQVSVKQEEVRLHGVVASMSGSTLVLTSTDSKTYSVDLSSAKLAGRNYFGTDMTKMKAGDSIQVWGKSIPGSLQVKANFVIDFSI